MPGADLITPLVVTPEATLADPNAMTRIDLRPFSSALGGLSGDIWVGFTVASGQTWLSQTTPGIAGRTYIYDGFAWIPITDDYHFRAITGPPLGAPEAEYSTDATADPDFAFTDLSTNSPTSWAWDFGDGSTSTDQDPLHTFTTNGDYNVCLTATNLVASDTECKLINVAGIVIAPVAAFSYDLVSDPDVSFTDMSTNSPDTWAWDLGDGTTSADQNPTHTYSTFGMVDVCLTSSNSAGSSPEVCQTLDVTGGFNGLFEPGKAGFSLYPNPVHSILNIQFDSPLPAEATISISDISGKIVRTEKLANGINQYSISLSALQTGSYFVNVELNQQTVSHTIQIVR
jgi:PKD repeat protein